jgi:hypothetical protein
MRAITEQLRMRQKSKIILNLEFTQEQIPEYTLDENEG